MCNDNSKSVPATPSDTNNFTAPLDTPLLSNRAMRHEIAQKFRLVLASFDRLGTAQDRSARAFLAGEIKRLEVGE